MLEARYLFSFRTIVCIILLLFQVLYPLYSLFQSRNCDSVSIHCRNEPLWQEWKQHIITCRQPRSMFPVPSRMRRMHAPQHRRSGCISANQRAWLVETYRPLLQQIGRSRRRVGAFILPQVKTPVRTNNEHNDNNSKYC
jgi:hypothetical protein